MDKKLLFLIKENYNNNYKHFNKKTNDLLLSIYKKIETDENYLSLLDDLTFALRLELSKKITKNPELEELYSYLLTLRKKRSIWESLCNWRIN